MNIKVIKLSYGILSIIAGLTVGLVLALYVGILAGLGAFMMFPFQVYTNCVNSAIEKKMKDSGLSSQENDKMWERHVRRMKDLNGKN
tara:strand:+ start:310 stop:570 length:261 start_codon:yes stop_codon:yes gene_type:complete